ncbi:unnamed protein product [Closterium sp. Yama58-4]|nr:unnamed protein product [Closterium sp. Yama58-4]
MKNSISKQIGKSPVLKPRPLSSSISPRKDSRGGLASPRKGILSTGSGRSSRGETRNGAGKENSNGGKNGEQNASRSAASAASAAAAAAASKVSDRSLTRGSAFAGGNGKTQQTSGNRGNCASEGRDSFRENGPKQTENCVVGGEGRRGAREGEGMSSGGRFTAEQADVAGVDSQRQLTQPAGESGMVLSGKLEGIGAGRCVGEVEETVAEVARAVAGDGVGDVTEIPATPPPTHRPPNLAPLIVFEDSPSLAFSISPSPSLSPSPSSSPVLPRCPIAPPVPPAPPTPLDTSAPPNLNKLDEFSQLKDASLNILISINGTASPTPQADCALGGLQPPHLPPENPRSMAASSRADVPADANAASCESSQIPPTVAQQVPPQVLSQVTSNPGGDPHGSAVSAADSPASASANPTASSAAKNLTASSAANSLANPARPRLVRSSSSDSFHPPASLGDAPHNATRRLPHASTPGTPTASGAAAGRLSPRLGFKFFSRGHANAGGGGGLLKWLSWGKAKLGGKGNFKRRKGREEQQGSNAETKEGSAEEIQGRGATLDTWLHENEEDEDGGDVEVADVESADVEGVGDDEAEQRDVEQGGMLGEEEGEEGEEGEKREEEEEEEEEEEDGRDGGRGSGGGEGGGGACSRARDDSCVSFAQWVHLRGSPSRGSPSRASSAAHSPAPGLPTRASAAGARAAAAAAASRAAGAGASARGVGGNGGRNRAGGATGSDSIGWESRGGGSVGGSEEEGSVFFESTPKSAPLTLSPPLSPPLSLPFPLLLPLLLLLLLAPTSAPAPTPAPASSPTPVCATVTAPSSSGASSIAAGAVSTDPNSPAAGERILQSIEREGESRATSEGQQGPGSAGEDGRTSDSTERERGSRATSEVQQGPGSAGKKRVRFRAVDAEGDQAEEVGNHAREDDQATEGSPSGNQTGACNQAKGGSQARAGSPGRVGAGRGVAAPLGLAQRICWYDNSCGAVESRGGEEEARGGKADGGGSFDRSNSGSSRGGNPVTEANQGGYGAGKFAKGETAASRASAGQQSKVCQLPGSYRKPRTASNLFEPSPTPSPSAKFPPPDSSFPAPNTAPEASSPAPPPVRPRSPSPSASSALLAALSPRRSPGRVWGGMGRRGYEVGGLEVCESDGDEEDGGGQARTGAEEWEREGSVVGEGSVMGEGSAVGNEERVDVVCERVGGDEGGKRKDEVGDGGNIGRLGPAAAPPGASATPPIAAGKTATSPRKSADVSLKSPGGTKAATSLRRCAFGRSTPAPPVRSKSGGSPGRRALSPGAGKQAALSVSVCSANSVGSIVSPCTSSPAAAASASAGAGASAGAADAARKAESEGAFTYSMVDDGLVTSSSIRSSATTASTCTTRKPTAVAVGEDCADSAGVTVEAILGRDIHKFNKYGADSRFFGVKLFNQYIPWLAKNLRVSSKQKSRPSSEGFSREELPSRRHSMSDIPEASQKSCRSIMTIAPPGSCNELAVELALERISWVRDLVRCSTVSKAWADAVARSVLHVRVDCTSGGVFGLASVSDGSDSDEGSNNEYKSDGLTYKTFLQAIRVFRQLTSLTVTSFHQAFGDAFLETLASSCPVLQVLDLSCMCYGEGDDEPSCHSNHRCNSHCNYHSDFPDQAQVAALASASPTNPQPTATIWWPRLKSVKLSNCCDVMFSKLASLFRQELTSMSLSANPATRCDIWSHASGSTTPSVASAKGSDGFGAIGAASCNVGSPEQPCSSLVLPAILSISRFRISHAETDTEPLVSMHPAPTFFFPTTLTSLYSRIRSLHLDQCPDAVLPPSLFPSLTRLTALSFSYCRHLKALPLTISLLSCLTSLHMHACHAVESLPLEALCLPGLRSMRLTNCRRLESVGRSFRSAGNGGSSGGSGDGCNGPVAIQEVVLRECAGLRYVNWEALLGKTLQGSANVAVEVNVEGCCELRGLDNVTRMIGSSSGGIIFPDGAKWGYSASSRGADTEGAASPDSASSAGRKVGAGGADPNKEGREALQSNPVAARLRSRGVIRFDGRDAINFLQGLLTNDVTPFLQQPPPAGFSSTSSSTDRHTRMQCQVGWIPLEPPELLADVDAANLDDLLAHLKKHKLRANVSFADVSSDVAVWAHFHSRLSSDPALPDEAAAGEGVGWGGRVDQLGELTAEATREGWRWHRDPRLPGLGLRGLFPATEIPPLVDAQVEEEEESYRRFRFALGVAEGCEEMPRGEALPLECNLAALHAISFTKGCYVGQELTARTHHRGVVRKRLMPVQFVPPGEGGGEGGEVDGGEEVREGSEEVSVPSGAEIVDMVSGKAVGRVNAVLLLLGPAAVPAFLQQSPAFRQQHVPSFPPHLQHNVFQPPQMTVAQQAVPRGSDSPRISADPAGRCGLHLIRGDAFDLRPQDSSVMPIAGADVSGADVAADIPSSIQLDDLISEYLEEGDEDRDAFDGLMLRTGVQGVAASTTVRSAHRPAQPNLAADYLDRQMQLTEQNQLRLIQSLAAMDGPVERALYADVIAAMTDARACHSANAGAAISSRDDDVQSQELRGSSLNAAVAGRLRAMGYDAAVCTTQWDTSPAIPEGSYEYIDVVAFAPGPPASSHAFGSASSCSTLVDPTVPPFPPTVSGIDSAPSPPTFTRTSSPTTVSRASPFPTSVSSASANGAPVASASSLPPVPAVPQRFIIDVDFRAQFQIARPTREYAAALESTPLIFVGRAERLARLVEVVSGAMRGALRAQGMHVPPWRKGEYLHAKWLAAVSRRVAFEVKGVEKMGEEGKSVVGEEGMEGKDKDKEKAVPASFLQDGSPPSSGASEQGGFELTQSAPAYDDLRHASSSATNKSRLEWMLFFSKAALLLQDGSLPFSNALDQGGR